MLEYLFIFLVALIAGEIIHTIFILKKLNPISRKPDRHHLTTHLILLISGGGIITNLILNYLGNKPLESSLMLLIIWSIWVIHHLFQESSTINNNKINFKTYKYKD
jgi:hypothetical protein